MNAANHVYAILLAAGASSRLGSPKQLLHWRNRPLLAHSIEQAQAVLSERVIVVLGANSDAIQTAVDLSAAKIIANPDWQQGVATSIRAGIQALPDTATAALILLCDQPLINAVHLQALLNVWQDNQHHIVASQYPNSVGVPALFPAEYFPSLLTLTGDKGAKALLIKFADMVLTISLPEAELDIDNSADFDYLTHHYPSDK
jgi:molybdenum cofactor cytidylyltransferase